MSGQPEQIREIFLEAVAINSPDARAAYVDEACGEDAEMRRRVESLIVAHERPESLLDKAALEANGRPVETLAIPTVGERQGGQIGPYKLLEQIGEGGFGVVYLAEQQQPVRRHVALKIIKPGMDTREVIARFEAERQALALMDHPGIARVLDAGATENGRPYFVMELVKGVPITDYCDRCNLTTDDRLKLFIDVCQAVQHAHQKGIIHRDVKPTNVLVAMLDGKPAVKVIDFGVAKAINQRLTERTLMTGLMQLVGTPLYMSPEQAEMGPLDIDTRSDIYSLGVLFYELLTGTTPFEKDRLKNAGYDELRRIIREEEPPKPSTRLSTLDAGAVSTVAERRQTDSRRLRQTIRGDLDWIVMKALDKDRNRRYETADALARDIQRYLRAEPAEACPPSARYRFAKLVRRNRTALVTTAAIAATLIAAAVLSSWQAFRATRAEKLAQERLIAETRARTEADDARDAEAAQRRFAETQRSAAEANLARAKATVDQYFTLVSEVKLLDVPGLQPLRKDLLESALEFYQVLSDERPDDPALLADLARTYLRLAVIYINLDRSDDAVTAADQALGAIERLRRHPLAGEYEEQLAGIWAAWRGMQRESEPPRDPKRAFETQRRLLAVWKQLADKYPANAALQVDLAAINRLISIHLRSARRERDAFPFVRDSVAILERLCREHPEIHQYRGDLVGCMAELATGLWAAGNVDEARAHTRRAVELADALVKECPAVPEYRAGLAGVLFDAAGRVDHQQEGKSLIQRAADVAKSLVQDYPDVALYAELQCHVLVGRAEALVGSATGSFKGLAVGRNATLPAWAGNAKIKEAEDACLEAIASCEPVAAKFPHNLLIRREFKSGLLALAKSFVASGCNDEALVAQRKAVAVLESVAADFPQDANWPVRLSRALGTLAEQLVAAGEIDEALAARRKAVTVLESPVADVPQDAKWPDQLNRAVRTLAAHLVAAGEIDEALAARRNAVAVLEIQFPDDPQSVEARLELANAIGEFAGKLDKSGRHSEAEQMYRKSLDVRKRVVEQFPDIAEYKWNLFHNQRLLGSTLWGMDMLDEAAEQLKAAQAVIEKLVAEFPDESKYRRWEADNLQRMASLAGESHASLGQWKDAAAALAQAAELQPKEHYPSYLLALSQLAAEDKQGYRQTCVRMLEQFAETEDADCAHFTAWSCVLATDATDDFSLPVQLAERAVQANANESAHIQTLGAVLYRAGRYQEALEKLAEADALVTSPSRQASTSPAYAWYFLAMTHHQLGNASQARSYLDRAQAWIDEALRDPNDGNGGSWYRLLTLRLLRDEAEKLIGIVNPDAAGAPYVSVEERSGM